MKLLDLVNSSDRLLGYIYLTVSFHNYEVKKKSVPLTFKHIFMTLHNQIISVVHLCCFLFLYVW